jgi:hypothetical protein
MSIGTKNEKCYLEVADGPDGFSIRARKRHAAELEALFRQHGIPCRRLHAGPEADTLVFNGTADRRKVEEVLTGYEGAKGS